MKVTLRPPRFIHQAVVLGLIVSIMLVACGPTKEPATVAPEGTSTPVPIETQEPTPTTTKVPTQPPTATVPIETQEPTPTTTKASTQSPTATATAKPETIVLSDFDAQRSGYLDRGNTAWVKYNGNQTELEGLTLSATILQEGVPIETTLGELVEGEYTFNMTDVKYRKGANIAVRIQADGEGVQLENADQTIDLGSFQYEPFIYPFLAESDFEDEGLGSIIDHGFEEGEADRWYAVDLCSRRCDPTGDFDAHGTPVYMPFTMQMLLVEGESSQRVEGYNMIFRNPYTGHVFLFCHQEASEELISLINNPELPYHRHIDDGKVIPYDPDRIISTWFEADPDVFKMIPHVHVEGQAIDLDHPDSIPGLWGGIYIWGAQGGPNSGNCQPDQNYGPCPPDVVNISVERYLRDGPDGWLKEGY